MARMVGFSAERKNPIPKKQIPDSVEIGVPWQTGFKTSSNSLQL